MLIKSIEINNFRNYKSEKVEFSPSINVIYGNNAQGKTNIIESIFIAAFGKSFRTNNDKEVIKIGENYCNLLINYNNKDRDGYIKIVISEKKYIDVNGIKIKKLSEILGNINVILFTPDDINILKEGPSKRRKFLDMLIGQIRPNYVYNLNLYLKVLEQRNNYIKRNDYNKIDNNLLDIFDEKLYEYGKKIYNYRLEYIEKIKKYIKKIHQNITENKEDIEIKYISDFETKLNFLQELKNTRKLDIIKGYTTKGIQKDDFVIYINGNSLNKYGSQGQHRTAVLSLKLCELNIIKEEIGENPILLLDDFMSELDEKRIKNILQNIEEIQVFITCTNKIKIENKENLLFYVNEGKIKKE